MIATQDAVILGRRSYDEWVEFWPGSEIEPFATLINGVAKHVATSAPLVPQWTNAHVIDGDLVEFTRRLKDGPGGDIGVHGSSVGCPGAAGRRHCRRAPARDRSEHRGRRTTTLRRAAADPVGIDPKRDLADWLSARRLSRYSLIAGFRSTAPCLPDAWPVDDEPTWGL